MRNDDRIVYGRHPVMRALKTPKKVEKVYMLQSAKGELEIKVRSICKAHDIPLVKTIEAKINKLCSVKQHQGIAAVIAPIIYQDIDDIIPHLYETNQVPMILVLDRVTDVRNFGAIARSAEVMGCHAILVPKKGSAALSKDAIKASAGALFDIPICRAAILEDAVDHLKTSGLMTVSLDTNGAASVDSLDYDQPVAFVLGSEEHGVKRELLKITDHTVKINQIGQTESLNVSVAASICLYEAQRQRLHKS